MAWDSDGLSKVGLQCVFDFICFSPLQDDCYKHRQMIYGRVTELFKGWDGKPFLMVDITATLLSSNKKMR